MPVKINAMELHCQLLLYFDKRRFLSSMEMECLKFLKTLNKKTLSKFPSFRYLLEIDVMDILDMFPEVGEYLIKEPLRWQKMCNEIIFSCLQSVCEDSCPVQLDQVFVNIRLKAVSAYLSRPNPRSYSGLVTFSGLLISVSKPTSYVYHTIWTCPEECDGNEVILQYIPKVSPKCYMCKTVLFENSGLRQCGEQVTAIFILNKSLLPKKFNVVDDLIPKLKIGVKYTIHTVVLKKSVAVWSVEEMYPLQIPLTHPIPSDVTELFNSCHGLPWKFIYCLASSIGVNVCPLNCFMHLKINLLISVTSVKAHSLTGSAIIHVLTAGYDTGYVARIMEEGSKLAARVNYLGTSNTTVPSILVGSSGGVCLMPLPLHSYNQKQISAILSAIESGEVLVDKHRVKVQAAIWAQGMDFKKVTLLNVASVFGNVSRGDCGIYGDDIAEFLLENAVEPTDITKEEVQAVKDVSLYIDIVSGIEVTLEKRAEELLRKYFLSARRERPRGLTVGSMGTLISTCQNSARLCRRSKANTDDAIFAIWLNVSGSPEPRFCPEEYLQTPADIKKLNKIMNQFKEWLEQFTGINLF